MSHRPIPVKKLASRSVYVLLFLALITWLSLSPKPLGGFGPKFLDIAGADKIVHVTLYGLFCLLVLWAYFGYIHLKRTYLLIVALIILYGILMEVFQGFVVVAGRTFSGWDIVANIAGVILAVAGFNFYRRIL